MLVRSAAGCPRLYMPGVVGPAPPSTVALRTLSGRDSRLPPNREDGARARTEASVSKERRRRRLEEDARVRMEALSVRRLLAVAEEYVVGWPGLLVFDGVRCAGMAEAGDVVGKGWLKWITCELERCGWWPLGCCWPAGARCALPFCAIDWMVVKVVARERTEGAGDEKVLSPPRRNSIPPFAVRLVPVRDEAPCDGAVDLEVSFSVDMVGAMDLPPAVGGARRSPASIDERPELSRAREVALVLVLLVVETE